MIDVEVSRITDVELLDPDGSPRHLSSFVGSDSDRYLVIQVLRYYG